MCEGGALGRIRAVKVASYRGRCMMAGADVACQCAIDAAIGHGRSEHSETVRTRGYPVCVFVAQLKFNH